LGEGWDKSPSQGDLGGELKKGGLGGEFKKGVNPPEKTYTHPPAPSLLG